MKKNTTIFSKKRSFTEKRVQRTEKRKEQKTRQKHTLPNPPFCLQKPCHEQLPSHQDRMRNKNTKAFPQRSKTEVERKAQGQKEIIYKESTTFSSHNHSRPTTLRSTPHAPSSRRRRSIPPKSPRCSHPLRTITPSSTPSLSYRSQSGFPINRRVQEFRDVRM
jgi:hypothetical protein